MFRTDENLKISIMRRITFLSHIERFALSLRAKIGWLIAVFALGSLLSAQVSIKDVVSNLFQVEGFSQLFNFLFNAISKTDLEVQIFVGVVSFLSVMIAKDLVVYYNLYGKFTKRFNIANHSRSF
jgi:hypothetical protein